jgi:hypothetical protein
VRFGSAVTSHFSRAASARESSCSVACKRHPTVASVNVANASIRPVPLPPEPASTPAFPRRHETSDACCFADRKKNTRSRAGSLRLPILDDREFTGRFDRTRFDARFGERESDGTLQPRRSLPLPLRRRREARRKARRRARRRARRAARRRRRRGGAPRRARGRRRRRRRRRHASRRARRRRRRRRPGLSRSEPREPRRRPPGSHSPYTPHRASVPSPRAPLGSLRVVRLHLRLHQRLLGESRRPRTHARVPRHLPRPVAAPELAGVVVGPTAQDVPRGVPRQAPDRSLVPASDLRARPRAGGVRVVCFLGKRNVSFRGGLVVVIRALGRRSST